MWTPRQLLVAERRLVMLHILICIAILHRSKQYVGCLSNYYSFS